MRIVIVVVLSGLAIAGTGLVLRSRSPVGSAVEASVIREPKRPEIRFYSYSRQINSDLISPSGGTPVLRLKLEGEVWLIPSNGPEGESWFRVGFALRSRTGADEIHSTLPVFFGIDPGLRLLGIRAPKAKNQQESDELNLIRDWVSLFAFGDPRDTAGESLARMEGTGRRRIKIKERYLGDEASRIEILESRHEMVLDQEGLAELIEGRERTLMSLARGVRLENRLQYRMERKKTEAIGRAAENWTKTGRTAKDDDSFLLTDLHLEGQEDAPNRPDFSHLERSFRTLREIHGGARLKVFHELVGGLRKEPARIPWFRALAESNRTDLTLFSHSIGVMASLDSDEAQSALPAWFGEEGGRPQVQRMILNALATTGVKLREGTIRFLLENLEKQEGAAYALGSSLRNQDRPEVRARLMDLYERAGSERERRIAMDAIRNSGDVFGE
jgi:hypothetical protein